MFAFLRRRKDTAKVASSMRTQPALINIAPHSDPATKADAWRLGHIRAYITQKAAVGVEIPSDKLRHLQGEAMELQSRLLRAGLDSTVVMGEGTK